jgi:plasmid maintenance system antidote protein VapI
VLGYLGVSKQTETLAGDRTDQYSIQVNDQVSADTAMRLARYFGGDARSWLNLQTAHDLRVAEISNAKRVAREVSPATT